MFLHVAPQTSAPFLVLFSAGIGIAILTEATLGFVGLGGRVLHLAAGNILVPQGWPKGSRSGAARGAIAQ